MKKNHHSTTPARTIPTASRIFVRGEYCTQFGELWDRSLKDLLHEAVIGVLKSAQIPPESIEAVFVSNKAAGSFEGQHHLNALVSSFFDHHPPAFRLEAACASGSLALLSAQLALKSGQYQTVLVVGAEKMTDVSAAVATEILSGATDAETEFGSTFPAFYALLANIYQAAAELSDVQLREALSIVASQNHQHALSNRNAHFQKVITPMQVTASSLVASPLRVLDCSPISDGAAAVVLSTSPGSKHHDPEIVGVGHAQDSLTLADRVSLPHLRATRKAATQAFDMAGVSAQDISLAEVHDCFTIAELLAVEDLGFVPEFQAAQQLLTREKMGHDKLIINPSGGLKACGHPVGATGVKQMAFLCALLRLQKHSQPAAYALAHNVGGTGATAIVHILKSGSGFST